MFSTPFHFKNLTGLKGLMGLMRFHTLAKYFVPWFIWWATVWWEVAFDWLTDTRSRSQRCSWRARNYTWISNAVTSRLNLRKVKTNEKNAQRNEFDCQHCQVLIINCQNENYRMNEFYQAAFFIFEKRWKKKLKQCKVLSIS